MGKNLDVSKIHTYNAALSKNGVLFGDEKYGHHEFGRLMDTARNYHPEWGNSKQNACIAHLQVNINCKAQDIHTPKMLNKKRGWNVHGWVSHRRGNITAIRGRWKWKEEYRIREWKHP